MTLSQDAVNVVKVDMYETVIAKADKKLSAIQAEVRALAHEDARFIASDILQVILGLRQALE